MYRFSPVEICGTVSPSDLATSMNLGMGGKSARLTFACDNLGAGGSGTEVLCARNRCGKVKLKSNKMKKRRGAKCQAK